MIKEMINSNLKKVGYKMIKLKGYLSDLDDHQLFGPGTGERFDYEEAVKCLLRLNVGLEKHVRETSIPEESLRYLERFFLGYFSSDKPIVALHVGNFLGISLVWAASCFKKIHKDSLVVSIDPNITHRGISYPLEAVVKLANYFRVQKSILFLVGYSLEKAVCLDSGRGMSFENILWNLALLSKGNYDVAFVDGNHDGAYVSRELEHIFPLLREDGIVVMDDVDEFWQVRTGLKDVFEKVDRAKFTKEGTDGRVGILKKL